MRNLDCLEQRQKEELNEEDKVPVVSLVEILFKAKQLEKQGRDVIHFDAGEPDFEPPNEVVEATVQSGSLWESEVHRAGRSSRSEESNFRAPE